MADLIDRLTHQSEHMSPPRPGILVHSFTGGLVLRATGAWTDAEVIQTWDLQGDELTQAQALLAVLNSKSNITSKIVYVEKVVAACLVLSQHPCQSYPTPNPYWNIDGTVNKARVAQDLEITL